MWYYIAGGLSSYVMISYYFLKHPLAKFSSSLASIHLTNAIASKPEIRFGASAHRGGAAERPENSLEAFSHATKQNMGLLELDVHVTKDRQIVVFHDHQVDRITQGHGLIHHFTYDEIPKIRKEGLLLPPPFHTPGQTLHFSPKDSTEQTEIECYTPPLLSTVFERFPHHFINIDIKHIYDASDVDAVSTLIEKYQRSHHTIWGSSRDQIAQLCHQKNRNIPMFFSGTSIFKLIGKYVTGILPFTQIKEAALEIPLLSKEAEQLFFQHHPMSGVKKVFAQSIFRSLHFITTRPSFLQHLQKRNIKVVFWVLNHENEFEEAYRLRADSIMTDCPTKLNQFLERKKKTSTK